MPRRERFSGAEREISSSRKKIRPVVGNNSPERRLTKVVLPAPLGPMTACNSPVETESDKLATASRPPKRLVTLSTRRIASGTDFLTDAARTTTLPSDIEQAADTVRQREHKQDDQDSQPELPM